MQPEVDRAPYVLRRMCARCQFEHSSQDLLGACAGLWTELWRRIEAEDPPSPTSSSSVNPHVELGRYRGPVGCMRGLSRLTLPFPPVAFPHA